MNVWSQEFIDLLDDFSGGRLQNQEDLALLFSLASDPPIMEKLERSAFLAKIIVKSRKIMNRIGEDADGYDKLSEEFAGSLREVTELLGSILSAAPEERREKFRARHLTLAADSLIRLFSLLEDLAWYKNWMIDNRDHRG